MNITFSRSRPITRANSAMMQYMKIKVMSRICTAQKRGQFIELHSSELASIKLGASFQ